MTPYAIKVGDITQEDLAILDEATVWLRNLLDEGNQSCHSVCAIWVGMGHPGIRRRGKWAKVAEHSWIELRPGVVLDLYPVAGVRPSLHVRLPIGDPYDATWVKP